MASFTWLLASDAPNSGLQPTWTAAFLPSKLRYHRVAVHAAEPGTVRWLTIEPQTRKFVLRAFEIALLISAFFFVIPPVPSTPAFPRMLPALILSTLFLAGSFTLAVRRGAESVSTAGLKLILFLVFFVALWERVRIS